MDISYLELPKNLKILVTGGAGFIGSNLCEALIKNGNEVVCFDNYATGKIGNIEHLLSSPNFTMIEGDIRDFEKCKQACNGVDYVLHQAALGSVPRSIKDPLTSNEVNVSGFLNVLLASKDSGVKRFIYAASSSTYGDSKNLPKVEHVIGKPLSPYAITKYANELYASVFSDIYGISTIGLRYFNVFGRKQDPNGAYAAVIPKFVIQLMRHESPTINGDGSYSRDFTYVENVIEANIRAIKVKEINNAVYNVAYGERTTISELVEILKKYLTDFDKEIQHVSVLNGPERMGDVPHSLASIEKAKSELGYSPKYNIEMGLKRATQWYFENYKNAL